MRSGCLILRFWRWAFQKSFLNHELLWFHNADESDPTDAEISQYIRQQHSPENNILLYRLLVRPWLKKKKSAG